MKECFRCGRAKPEIDNVTRAACDECMKEIYPDPVRRAQVIEGARLVARGLNIAPKTDVMYMSLKEDHELTEVFKFLNNLAITMAGAPFLCPTIEDLNERIKNWPDQFGNYRVIKLTAEIIDG